MQYSFLNGRYSDTNITCINTDRVINSCRCKTITDLQCKYSFNIQCAV